MGSVLDYLLDGLEAELALERELGVRSFEFDRALLAPVASAAPAAPPPPPPPRPEDAPRAVPRVPPPKAVAVPPPASADERTAPLAFVFLHDRPLTPAGEEMMAKIVAALGQTSETAPIVLAAPVPRAKAYIVLGRAALRKWFPGKNVGMGQWFTSEKGRPVLVTYSPNDILRYATVTPALRKLKQDMWTSLKSVLKKVQSEA